ncbi:MAG: 6-phosphogluconolactonase [Spirochaetia bacterium]|nr:6-phosphogluconolactonase [Spirochaetia bacterium]
MKTIVKRFGNLNSLSSYASALIIKTAKAAVKKHGCFTLCVSGGEAPRPLYRLLAKSAIPWKKTFIFWQDDRFIKYDSENSNVKNIYDNLIKPADGRISPDNIFPAPSPEMIYDPATAALAYEMILRRLFNDFGQRGLPSMDMIIAGVGPDGHTASLFPGDKKALEEKNRLVINVKAPKGMAVKNRITMTLPMINNAKDIIFVISGEGKTGVMKAVLKGNKKYPAARVKAKGKTTWLLDGEYIQMV